MDIFSVLPKMGQDLFSGIGKWKSDKDLQRNLLIIESRSNLDLLKLLEWKRISNDFKTEVCKQLSTDACEFVIAYGDKNAFWYLFEQSSSQEKEAKIISLICKIKILKRILAYQEKFPDIKNPSLTRRVANIKKLQLEVLDELNKSNDKK